MIKDIIDTDVEAIISYYNYELNITEATNIKILFSLNEEEYFDDKYIIPKPDISIGILKFEEEKWTIFHSQDFVFDKQLLLDLRFEPGLYCIIPT